MAFLVFGIYAGEVKSDKHFLEKSFLFKAHWVTGSLLVIRYTSNRRTSLLELSTGLLLLFSNLPQLL